MKAPKAFWIGLICAVGGCTQLLELDQEYRPGQTSGTAGTAGTAGSGGTATGGGGSGGGECVVDMDCPVPISPCAVNKCVANACVTNALPAGSPCTAEGNAVCDKNGICGDCNQPSDCTKLPADNDCQSRTCTNHVCSQKFIASGTLATTQTTGDCQDVFCDGFGKTVSQANDTDLPDDNNPCTKNVCMNGKPSYPAEPINTSCGANLKCNDMGQCVGCIAAGDCAGADDFCKTRTCINGVCGFNYTAAGTNLPTGQTVGDCKTVECNGQGATVSTTDNADIPDDGNACTKNVCSAGTPSNPPEPISTPCGMGGLCDGSGVCEKPDGATCTAAADCASGHCVEGVCCEAACNQNCKACNIPGALGVCAIVPKGYSDDSCPSPKSCDGTTGQAACVDLLPNGAGCASAAQCGTGLCVDGVCCTSTCTGTCKSCNVAGSAGTCANVPANQEDTGTCSGTNVCNGSGTCKKKAGQTCSLASECLSNFCVDGVCCNNACTTTCQSCAVTGSVGTCSNVPLGDKDLVATTTCTGSNACNGAGQCLLASGQPCTLGAQCASNICTGAPLTCQ